MKDTNPSYWEEYTNLQYIKHKLIREYLNGWLPKLGSWCGRILYIDTHAGRGKHTKGQEGSPLVAMRTFLEHRWRDKILKNCEVRFMFIEADKENTDNLQKEIAKLGKLPQNTFYDIHNQNAFELLNDLANKFEKTGSNLAPCFMFIDPYGFKVPCSSLKRIKRHSRSELLITLIWRELDMAMRQKRPPTGLLDSVFGDNEWRNISQIDDFDARSEAAIQLLKGKIGTKWATYIRMLGDNQKTRYLLLHLTDHETGRDLMKDVAWKCCPDNGYYARKSDDPQQQYLIKPEPDLKPLENWLVDKLSYKDYNWAQLSDLLREEIWLNKHLWRVITELKTVGRINTKNFFGSFSQKANPTLHLIKN